MATTAIARSSAAGRRVSWLITLYIGCLLLLALAACAVAPPGPSVHANAAQGQGPRGVITGRPDPPSVCIGVHEQDRCQVMPGLWRPLPIVNDNKVYDFKTEAPHRLLF